MQIAYMLGVSLPATIQQQLKIMDSIRKTYQTNIDDEVVSQM